MTEMTEATRVVDKLEAYIQTHGLPREYGPVIKYLFYLRTKA